jgi:hypothetical protein
VSIYPDQADWSFAANLQRVDRPPNRRDEFLEEVNRVLGPQDFSREQLLKLFTTAPKAFWRHDIDLSLDAAVRMARFAQIAGVQSHFFLMTASPFYNVFSPEGAHTIDRILDCGHVLGLHCDHREGNVLTQVERERQLLDAAYPDLFSNAVSFHMPGLDVLWKDFTPYFVNAYGPVWEGRYVSDSRGRPITESVTDEMQVSLHPEHWVL